MRQLRFPALSLLLMLLLSACAWWQDQDVPPADPKQEAVIHFQEGEALFEQGLYKDAIASWEKVREGYYSPELNTLAELKIAEAHFRNEQYIEAAAAYQDFLKKHPDHLNARDALYQLGICYLNQVVNRDQDQAPTRNALATFQNFLKLYPRDHRNAEVQDYIARCLNHLAGNELVVSQFYLKAGKYKAAINRLEGLLKKYPGFYESDEAYYLLGQAYLLEGDRGKSEEAFNTLFTQFPYSAFVPDAQKFLAKNP